MDAHRLAGALGRPQAPGYLWLAERIRGLVLDGVLVVGERVPAERSLAAALGLSRTTVTAAYGVLRDEDYLRSRQGASTLVHLPVAPASRPDRTRIEGAEIDLTVASLPAPPQLAALAADAVGRLGPLLAGHGLHPLGIPELRAAVAARFTARGLRTSPDQVLVTQGALHGWDLALRALTRPGDAVLVEQPTYPAVLDAAAAHSLRVVPLAVTPAGWHLLARRAVPVLAHVTPDVHNPTGRTANGAARRSLRRALAATTLVLDETFAELSFDPVPGVAAGGRTIIVGSLSKPVWAGLRIGWLRAEHAVVRRIAMSRAGQDLAGPVLEQLLAAAALGELDNIVRERISLLRARCDHLLTSLRQAFPEWTIRAPDGGLVLWADLGDRSSTDLAAATRRHGLRLSPGTRFSATGTHDRFLRLPFCHPEPVLDEVVARLRRAVAEPLRSRSRTELTWTA